MIPPHLTTFATKIGVSGAIIAALGVGWSATLVGTYADMRFEGPFGIGIGYEGWKPKAERMERERDAAKDAQEAQEREYRAAQAEAAERAVQARVAAQERYAAIARNADNELEQARRDALADARAFIERSRLRASSGIRGSGSVATPGDSDTGVPVRADAATELDGYILVLENDVLICTINTTDIEAAKAWAPTLNSPTP